MSAVICPQLSKYSLEALLRVVESQTYKILYVIESSLSSFIPKPPQGFDLAQTTPQQKLSFANVLLGDILGRHNVLIFMQEMLPDPLKSGTGSNNNQNFHLNLRVPMYYSTLARMFLFHLPPQAKNELVYNENRELGWLTTTDAQHPLPQLIQKLHIVVEIIVRATILRIMLQNIQRNPLYLSQTPADRIIEDNKAAITECIAYCYGVVIPFVGICTYATQVQLQFTWSALIAAGQNLIMHAQTEALQQFGPQYAAGFAQALELYNMWWLPTTRETCGPRASELLHVLENQYLDERYYAPVTALLHDDNIINALLMHGIHVVIPEWAAFQDLPTIAGSSTQFQSVRGRWINEVLNRNHSSKGHAHGGKQNLNKHRSEGARSGLIGSGTSAPATSIASNSLSAKMYNPAATYNMMPSGYGAPYMPAPMGQTPMSGGMYGAPNMQPNYGAYPQQPSTMPGMMPNQGGMMNNPYAPNMYGQSMPLSSGMYGMNQQQQPQPYSNSMTPMPLNTTPMPLNQTAPGYYQQPNMMAYSAPPAYGMLSSMPNAYNATTTRM